MSNPREDLIQNSLRPIAAAIAKEIAPAIPGNSGMPLYFEHNDPYFDYTSGLRWTYTDETGANVKFYLPNNEDAAYIEFKNIRVSKVESGDLSLPVISDSSGDSDIELDVITNSSDGDTSLEFKYETLTTVTSEESFLATVEASLKQSIWYGTSQYSLTPGTGGKTELQLDLGFAYENKRQETSSDKKTQVLNVNIPARSIVSITQSQSVSKFNQDATTTGRLDFGIECHQRGHSQFEFDSFQDMISAARGYFPPTGRAETDRVVEWWKDEPVDESRIQEVIDTFDENGVSTVITRLSFERASTGKINIASQPLNPGN